VDGFGYQIRDRYSALCFGSEQKEKLMMQILVLILMVIGCLAFMMVATTFMTKRAMIQVLRILKYHGAVNEESAKTVEFMGLNPPSFRERLMKMRDYKPKALHFLMNFGIVQSTEDGRIFLSENKLLASDLLKRWPSLARAIQPR
jgi:hypothetical protein